MNDQVDSTSIPTELSDLDVPEEIVELDDVDMMQIQQAMDRMKGEENFLTALLAGAAAGVLGAVLWAVITATTGYQIGFMAIGVGFLVGFAVRQFGRGVSTHFGVLAAALSLIGCVLGNLLSIVAVISREEGLPIGEVLSLLNFDIVRELMVLTFHPLDVLFYGLALYYGYKLSFRQVTAEELGLPPRVVEQTTGDSSTP